MKFFGVFIFVLAFIAIQAELTAVTTEKTGKYMMLLNTLK
jgi:hypothetical protein